MNALPPTPVLPQVFADDSRFVRLARETAMEIHDLETILRNHAISPDEWARISSHPRFQALHAQYLEAWNSATSTAERVKLKSLAFVEEALPEFFARAHDKNEVLSSKVEVLKTVAKFAGVGQADASVMDAGGKFTVTINIGDQSLSIEKRLPPQVIEHEPAPALFSPEQVAQANMELA